MKNIIPKVLIATPVSERHAHLLDDWLKSLDSLDYDNIEICLCDTTPDTDRYYKLLKTKTVKGKPIHVIRHEWDYEKWLAVQWMAFAREKIRDYFLKENFEYLMWLDDDIFLPKWGIQRLLSYNKDQVGFYVHVYFEPKTLPCLLKTGEIIMGKGLDYFTWDEIDAYKDFVKRFKEDTLTEFEKNLVPFIIKERFHPQLFKTYAVNLGCLMVKREVVEKVPFRTHETFVYGEDLWYFAEANDKGFEFWCDSNYRCEHKNTEWGSLAKKGPQNKAGGFTLAFGPTNAEKLEFVQRKENV